MTDNTFTFTFSRCFYPIAFHPEPSVSSPSFHPSVSSFGFVQTHHGKHFASAFEWGSHKCFMWEPPTPVIKASKYATKQDEKEVCLPTAIKSQKKKTTKNRYFKYSLKRLAKGRNQFVIYIYIYLFIRYCRDNIKEK